jgi:SIR2-like domain
VWLDRQAEFPSKGSADEYGFYIEACFPISADRRAYFAEKIRAARPHLGYHILCKLAESALVDSVWTTNFDGLPARAAGNYSVTPIEVGIDSQERLPRQVRSGELLTVSLHGDYRYDALRNTPEELQQQETSLRKALIERLNAMPCLVVGYSGRDRSIMQTFEEAYSAKGTSTLYWCGFAEITNEIENLLETARAAGRKAFYIPILGFDDLMTRLGLFASDGAQRDLIKQIVASFGGTDTHSRRSFSIPKLNSSTVIKSNAFEVECPSEVFAFDLKEWPKEHVWQYLRSLALGSEFVAAPFKGKVLAIGLLDSIKSKFGENIKGAIERVPITTDDLRYEDGAVTRIMREALVRSLVQKSGVHSDGHSELWKTTAIQTTDANGVEYQVFESVIIFLRRLGESQFLLLKPSVRVIDKSGNPAPDEVSRDVKLTILGGQYNAKFNAAVNAWRTVLLSSSAVIDFPYNSASTFRFRISKAPIFAEIGAQIPRTGVDLSRVPTKLLRHKGFELNEPSLLFSRRDGSGIATDVHPMRGVLENRPYDFPLTRRNLATEVRVGVVCPKAESKLLEDFLQNAQQRQRVRSNPEYLLEYPGFQQAYGVPLNTPRFGETSWAICTEPTGSDSQSTARDLARNITVAIESLRASSAISVVLILVPERWRSFEGYTTDDEKFDLHDFVKAYCVQKGITSQFLRQTTLAKDDLCQLWWWLSLALYVKAMRTPWVLASLEEETAFVGLGFSISPTAERGRHVILGCSHVYSARGEGLQYRLSKIENPVFRGGNPFMSRDDARRVGETTRQLFFDSRFRLPDRVVFHKRTPFLREEREGLLEGLSGVKHVEMLEIQIDSALRYVASIVKGNQIDEDNFPVRRGTAVKLDDFSALVWVHGVTSTVHPQRKYFQGKRRIPAPVHVRRHLGDSDLNRVAEEILALSKMNWNTFNLYTKVPATIQSSNEIARIGALLERFGAESYDYRLFI